MFYGVCSKYPILKIIQILCKTKPQNAYKNPSEIDYHYKNQTNSQVIWHLHL